MTTIDDNCSQLTLFKNFLYIKLIDISIQFLYSINKKSLAIFIIKLSNTSWYKL